MTHTFKVVHPSGELLADGGVKWKGILEVDGKNVAIFENDGCGGCNTYNVRPADDTRDLFKAARKYADRKYGGFEPLDKFVGELWDAALMAEAS